MQFEEFFEKAHKSPPFPYQVALATQRDLPDLLRAPTGSGKTAAAILGWLWRRRHAGPDVRAATPRRLVFALPMRSLVGQTMGAAEVWLKNLGVNDVGVHGLLGGAVDQRWEDHSERDAILIGTQDQLLSRALNRGYGMSRYRWSVHFALVNNDALWVMDEVQLMGVGLSTSAQLAAFRRRWATFGPTHTLWMSATLDERLLGTVDAPRPTKLHTLALSPDDRAHAALRPRLEALKRLHPPLELFDVNDGDYAKKLAPVVLDQHKKNGGVTLVILNRVARAQELAKRLSKDRASEVLLLHSRYRPQERALIEGQIASASWTGILVATQAIEAGVDLTSRTLFTELCPWSSLVQRFGRCNRRGECSDGADVFWLNLPDKESHAAPYEVADMIHARALLGAHTEVGPSQLASGRRASVQPQGPVLRARDLEDLFDTTADLSGFDVDVSRYIRDTGSPEVQIAWRTWEGANKGLPPSDRIALHRDELCRAPIGKARDLIKKAKSAYFWDPLLSEKGLPRGGWSRVSQIIPGQRILLPVEAGGYCPSGQPALGLTFKATDKPAPVVVEVPVPATGDGDDQDAAQRGFSTLRQHSLDIVKEAKKLLGALVDLGPTLPAAKVLQACHWHDLGTVHPRWQAVITSNLEPPGPGPWAKRPRAVRAEFCTRAYFRHELASGLAYLGTAQPDHLVAYMIVCHHGKVRVGLRSRPGERGNPEELKALGLPEGSRVALGVYDGETLPGADLGDGLHTVPTRLDLSLMELGLDSWTSRSLALLDQWGPFKLAFLESLVRASDWRASANPGSETLEESNA